MKQDEELQDFLNHLKNGYPPFDEMEEVTIYSRTSSGDYPIHYAVVQNRISVVRQMVEKGIDVNILDEYECTPLDNAILHKHKELAEYLKSKGGELNRV